MRPVLRGPGHAIRFTRIDQVDAPGPPIEVPCSLESLEEQSGVTLLRYRLEESGGLRLVKAYIEGDDAAHVF